MREVFPGNAEHSRFVHISGGQHQISACVFPEVSVWSGLDDETAVGKRLNSLHRSVCLDRQIADFHNLPEVGQVVFTGQHGLVPVLKRHTGNGASLRRAGKTGSPEARTR